jgi:nucleoside-diphosphate kinase
MERTLVILKPDAIQRGLAGEIITRLEKRGLKIAAAKFMQVSKDLASKHYAVHIGKPFYEGLVKYITSSPVLVMVWEGPEAISAVRQTMGATNPLNAAPGTIRHDLALNTSRNLTHASDGVETAEAEIKLWFAAEELVSWEQSNDPWINGKN